jgi:hypothetical protein
MFYIQRLGLVWIYRMLNKIEIEIEIETDGLEIQFKSFFNLSARGGVRSTPPRDHFTPGREPRYPL